MDEILNVIDGIESKGTEIITVLTTNNLGNITSAMLRPGRLDAIVSVRAPDAKAAQQLVRLYAGTLLAADDDLQFAIRTDISATFILPALADPTVLGNWVQLPMPSTTGLEMQANKDAASGYAGLDAGGLLKVAEFPILDGGTP